VAETPGHPDGVSTTNFEKFQTGNPVVRRLIENFYGEVARTIAPLSPDTALDAGCGEGESLVRLGDHLPERLTGVDTNAESVEFTRKRVPAAEVFQEDLLEMHFDDRAFGLVLCLEVLEHIPDPAAALAQLARVCGSDLVISVPHEPWFRLGSLARGKYVRTFGNHPEHVNHWNPRSLRTFLESQVEVVTVTGSMPWLIAHCRPRR